ncbi:PD-(D/E)XK nuclease family protein [Thermophagus xiamenensis]|uniref:PD-(D/E)XK nuclease superfamily protein n=1 Tax=Thermophagus xiamenensis TaxID=385682 RepID=A0A1I1VR46_9BACT|nr:PD-(D/E)XK nuclease family protein [Thermophagus xiamenensis]SFD85289.1 PD-(D/E)XK nuclease superfamily protein [Thermophagus xiamenensis]
MSFFLERLAEYYLQKYSTDISDFCFVFPNRRAGVFFRRHLQNKSPKPIFSPEILTINDFFFYFDKRPVSDNISLIFKLYQSYKEVIDPKTTIDDFIPWGEMCLSDFDDIDKYLADPNQIFKNMADLKALEDDFSHLNQEQIDAIRTFWSSFDPKRLSQLQKSFLELWERMPLLYEHFNDRLDRDREIYEGKLYRSVAQKIKNKTIGEVPFSRVIFAGLNALNNCEKLLLNYLKTQNIADFFWDYPQWILTNPAKPNEKISLFGEHEAARFIKQNLQDFPMPSDWESPTCNGPSKIIIAQAANDLEQTQIAAQFLKDISDNQEDSDHTKTAVVLADETLMLPVIHAIPSQWKSINVTLGYPLKNTPAYSLIDALMTLQRTTRTTANGKTWFYHRHLIGLLRHQYVSPLLGDKRDQLINQLIKANKVFIEKDQIPENDFIKKTLTKVETIEALSSYFMEILLLVYKSLKERPDTDFEQEFVYHLYLTIKRLGEILGKLNEPISTDTWYRLFRKLTDFSTIPFKGEPLNGLQIMGILETRVIDFDNLIITSMNEGTFPHTSPPNSAIPYNLRKGFGLPTIDHQDSIFAYYFYRLIHRAKKVILIWSASDANQQTGEMSRFLHQLYYEFHGKVVTQTYVRKAGTKALPQIMAEKNKQVMVQLSAFLHEHNRALSPSALSTYVECPLRFYYKYLVGAKEPEDISEELDPRIFGNLFHQTVEALYKPFMGQIISEDILKQIAQPDNLRNTLKEIFSLNVPFIKQKQNVFIDLQGKNSLVFEVLIRYLTGFFQNEIKKVPFVIKGLEYSMGMVFKTPSGRSVYLGGNIDRLEEKEGTLKVVDYKTGKGTNRINDIESLFDSSKHPENKAIFQTLLYSLMVEEQTRRAPSAIQPSVVWMRKLFTDSDSNLYLQPVRGKKEVITLDLVKTVFVDSLGKLLDELFDPHMPFKQTPEEKNCNYCIYKEICLKG